MDKRAYDYFGTDRRFLSYRKIKMAFFVMYNLIIAYSIYTSTVDTGAYQDAGRISL